MPVHRLYSINSPGRCRGFCRRLVFPTRRCGIKHHLCKPLPSSCALDVSSNFRRSAASQASYTKLGYETREWCQPPRCAFARHEASHHFGATSCNGTMITRDAHNLGSRLVSGYLPFFLPPSVHRVTPSTLVIEPLPPRRGCPHVVQHRRRGPRRREAGGGRHQGV